MISYAFISQFQELSEIRQSYFIHLLSHYFLRGIEKQIPDIVPLHPERSLGTESARGRLEGGRWSCGSCPGLPARTGLV